MKTATVYFFSFGEMERLAKELNLRVDYNKGNVCFNDLNFANRDGRYNLKMKEKVKEKYAIKEDLTDYAWCCEDGDQYWKQPVMLIPSCF